MSIAISIGHWVCCSSGVGYQHEDGVASPKRRHFPASSVGVVRDIQEESVSVWLIGRDEIWDVSAADIRALDVIKTGDKFEQKICNICHRLLPTREFARNQNNKHGIVRRPSCKDCRSDIDKRAPKTRQAKDAEKRKPKKGEPFRCPICRRRSIVGVTAKIVADHNHHTGNIRDFICDSCNTGLGRFKNGHDYLQNAIQYLKERD